MPRVHMPWHIQMWHDSFIKPAHSIQTQHPSVRRVHMWRASLICATYLIHICHGSFTYDMTHSWNWTIASTTSVVCGAFICDMPHSWVWHDSFIRAWHASYIYPMTRSHATWHIHLYHDSFIRAVTQSSTTSPQSACMHVTYVKK